MLNSKQLSLGLFALLFSLALPARAADAPAGPAKAADANPIVVMQVSHEGKPLGKILMKLFPQEAPESTKNFLKLINNKFYDGLTFHRIADLDGSSPSRIVQGGDPKGDGTGGPGWNIKGEFLNNHVNNPLKHNAGALAMARSGDPNSAGSQFYICVNPVHFLDGNYAVFGQVISGLDVAAKIQQGDKMTSVTVKK
ncbi:MAG TPA: peptidylprolyl isomerase [Capsulimonadaceae bacterium]|jgi:peptidyl-prolyl cis-trans isomerase B (cyclophilin B)